LTAFGPNESFAGCGTKMVRRKKDMAVFVYNGTDSKVARHPWHAALIDDERGYNCGGSLVSITVVVTGEMYMYTHDNRIMIL
jgi:hypothetical protein